MLGPVLFARVLALPVGDVGVKAHRLAAVFAWAVVYWVTEALPVPVTAILASVLCIVLGVASAQAVLLGIVLSEASSNTAAASMVIPTVIAVASSTGVSPIPPALGAALGASFGFMLPVSTPPSTGDIHTACGRYKAERGQREWHHGRDLRSQVSV